MLFNIEYLQHVDSVLVGNRNVYHQVYNPSSAMRRFSLNSNLCGLRSMELQKAAWRKVTPEIELAWQFHYRDFSRTIICGLVGIDAVEENLSIYKQCVRNVRRNLLLPWRVNIPMGVRIRVTLFSLFPSQIARRRKRKTQKLLAKMDLK